uniref:Uncharacterized protein n=1 Tax=Kalanchoe fedtschenkoi TaxID=63787 RepID=A0A7N0VKM8_KALFE
MTLKPFSFFIFSPQFLSFFTLSSFIDRWFFFLPPTVLGSYPTQRIEGNRRLILSASQIPVNQFNQFLNPSPFAVPHSTMITNQNGLNPQLTDNRSVAMQKYIETRERRDSMGRRRLTISMKMLHFLT